MNARIKRRGIMAAGVGAMTMTLLDAAGGTARARSAIKVRLGVVTVSSQMGLQIAVAKGFFARHGFDVTLRPLASGAQANEALASGQVDWSAGGIESTIVATSVGLPFEPYAMYAKGGDSLGILVRADADIHNPQDLKGKRIAVVTGTASAEGLNQLLKANGLDERDVRLVNAKFSTMGLMLAAGSVDAIVALEPFLTVTMDKMGRNAVLLTRLGKYVQGGGFFLMSNAWVAAHPHAVEPAVEALAEALLFVRQHPAEAAKLNAGFVKADPAIIERSSKVFDFTCGIDPFTIASLKTASAYLVAHKVINKPVDIDKLLAPARRVTGELRKRHPDLWK